MDRSFDRLVRKLHAAELAHLRVLVAQILLWSALASPPAHAQTLGLHTLTWHSQPGYQAATPGLYWRADNGLTLGLLRNSEGRASAYAGHTWQSDTAQPLSVALTLALVSGYRLAPVLPAAVPSVALRVDDTTALRLSALPRWHAKQGASALHLALEWRL